MTGFINSSYAILFHLCVFFTAPFFANYFPDKLGLAPLFACIALPIILFWFFWLMRNHAEISFITFAIPAFSFICAFFAVVSVIIGPLNDSEVAVIATPYIPLLNLFFVSYTGTAPVLASVIMYYAAMTYIAAAILAFGLETIYNVIVRRFLPRQFNKKLASADVTIDRSLFSFFDREWLMGQTIGSIVTLVLLVLFAVVYTITVAAF